MNCKIGTISWLLTVATTIVIITTGEPEVTLNLNESPVELPLHPLEELEEDMFDYEADNLLQDTNTESEEQVVPSSQLSNSYKYPEELTISDDEIDEGIFEEEPASTLVLPNDNNTYDSQPP
ncbi:uncharacterized protein LOC122395157 isoform X2 [Colletes gigas]|uniref:uncharacterized protein LOC122395157 isoform X2 n=1 Tax=Colletes gigas TaxID=935657 RepID=UPI001C9A939C|nr:uncharacterized protein LOC122395157 isoform X2 [Colletes gigas]XP_043248467.1 uncharacterized protein LOC122395157 isoform X2 [Colletes gigas]